MHEPLPRPRVFCRLGGERRFNVGRPWVFANEIRMDSEAKAIAAGSLVTLTRVDGKPLGVGSFNANSLIAFRLFDHDPNRVIDSEFLAARLQNALRLRERLYDQPYYRLVHAEGDLLPGLIIDRFADTLVLQVNTAGMDRLTADILRAVDRVLDPRCVVLRNDQKARALEGLAQEVTTAKGEVAETVETVEDGHLFFADVRRGQKTGWFFDQRDNRSFVTPLARGGAMLDVYCHSGGFAILAATGGARRVVAIDASEAALALARRAASANGVSARCEFRQQEAFDALAALGNAGEQFRLVVADPPAFVKSRKDLGGGLRAYRKLARLAAALVEPGGFLFTASCSHHVEAAAFVSEVARGLSAARRVGRIVRQSGAGPDHPIHPHLPETAYLKALLLQLD